MTTKTAKTKKVPKANLSKSMKADVYNTEGKKAGTIDLPESVFGVRWNADLVHRTVVAMQSNAREPWAHSKDRSEQRGGGRKPWRQKGTGRARHGSRRSPIWRGGGVTFGPRNERDYSKKINKKARAKALYSVLSRKFSDGEILFVDKLVFENPKAREAKEVLKNLGTIKGFEALLTKKKNTAFLALGSNDVSVKRSFSNFGNVEVDEARNLNPIDVLTYKYLVISDPKESLEQIVSRLSKE